ncbi:MAG: hypothetical protein LiPW39_362 [Parcubacteria group bacterium LiPW_39]|nr:MAG: hypothetical protein LiPW39_362 [Parcubacteria group bacterium LiPW_39]
MYLEILEPKRKKFLSKLGFLKEYGFYMAGGTALALQIGHRTSLDFDFYTNKSFDSAKLYQELRKRFGKVIFLQKAEDTLIVKLDEVAVSFFYYPYPIVFLSAEIEGVPIASKQDIAAMKIIAISDRGTKRDFIDVYFLLKEFSLEEIFEFVKKKYPEFNIYVGLRGLTYFADAEKKQQRKLYLFKSVSWAEIKKFLIKEVRKFQKNA